MHAPLPTPRNGSSDPTVCAVYAADIVCCSGDGLGSCGPAHWIAGLRSLVAQGTAQRARSLRLVARTPNSYIDRPTLQLDAPRTMHGTRRTQIRRDTRTRVSTRTKLSGYIRSISGPFATGDTPLEPTIETTRRNARPYSGNP